MSRTPLAVPATAGSKDAPQRDSAWRRRSLLRVRRPAWSAPAKAPAGR